MHPGIPLISYLLSLSQTVGATEFLVIQIQMTGIFSFACFSNTLIIIMHGWHGCLWENGRVIHHFLIEFPDTDFYHFLLIRFTVKRHVKWNNLNIFFLL